MQKSGLRGIQIRVRLWCWKGMKVWRVRSAWMRGDRNIFRNFKYLGLVLYESSNDGAECCSKVASGSKVAGAIRLLVNAGSLQLQCAKVLHGDLLMPVGKIYD